MKAGSYIMAPYLQSPVQIVIRELQSSTSSATNIKRPLVCTYNGTGTTLSCSCTNTTATVPATANLVGTNDAVILSQVTCAYKPLVFDDFMKRNYASSGGTYTLDENIHQEPRGRWPVLLQSNGTACPPPTFPKASTLPGAQALSSLLARRPPRARALSAACTMGRCAAVVFAETVHFHLC
jgi:hypothetical protein